MNINWMFTTSSEIALPDNKSIVFLDVDGVICPYGFSRRWDHNLENTAEYLAKKYNDDLYLRMPISDLGGAYYDWDLESLGKLKKLLDYTESEIVIHSDLRIWNDLESFKGMFRLYGMDEYVIDVCNPKLDKIETIEDYLNKTPNIENYVIFDDNDELKVFGDNFIYTKNLLTDENIDAANKVLLRY